MATKVTRRQLAVALGVASTAPAPALAQASTPTAADLPREVRDLLKSYADQMAQVKVPMTAEPATHFKA